MMHEAQVSAVQSACPSNIVHRARSWAEEFATEYAKERFQEQQPTSGFGAGALAAPFACCLSRRRLPVFPNTTFPALALLAVPFAAGAADFACASGSSTHRAHSLHMSGSSAHQPHHSYKTPVKEGDNRCWCFVSGGA